MTRFGNAKAFCGANIRGTADEIAAAFDRRSPFAFVSDPQEPQQRFVGLSRRGLKIGVIELVAAPDLVLEGRTALIYELRRRRHIVCDIGNGRRMTQTLRAIYGRERTSRVSMGLELPLALALALIKRLKGALH